MNRIKALREERQAASSDPSQWTQAGLADRIGVHVGTVKAWETDRQPPTGWRLKRLAKILGVAPEDITGD